MSSSSSGSSAGPISVPLAIILGLLSSFVQSLGLTLQRKSHLQDASLPASQRRRAARRPLWLVGFGIFLLANVGGSVFQIGALPIVLLAPLGAVSLLFNALLARFLLDDLVSGRVVGGTVLIALGAVLIAYFGVVPESPHSLDELLALYARPAFIAFASVWLLAFLGVLVVAHLAEWSLHARLQRLTDGSNPKRRRRRRSSSSDSASRRLLQRRWSAPSLAPVAEVSESTSGVATPVLAISDAQARREIDAAAASEATPLVSGTTARSKADYGALSRSPRRPRSEPSAAVLSSFLADPHVRRTRLGLSVAYGGASGTLSGMCLLLAKSGVELLELTARGENQFGRWQAWALVGVLVAAAVLQLWYLNKALTLADPTLICPLAFCFYNTSSIVLGLVYFDQLGSLSLLSILLVVLGTAILLTGVWLVSLHSHSAPSAADERNDAAEVVASPESSALSPTDTSETTALLGANAAGIAGPHLPPISPASDDSPPPSPSASRFGSPRARRHSRSGSLSVAGLGLVLPPSPLDSFDVSPSFDGAQSGEQRAASSGAGATTSPTSPTAQRQRRTLYSTLLQRGLSIGISPSSPGFHIHPAPETLQALIAERAAAAAAAEAEEAAEDAEAWRRRPRRTLSEGDALHVEAQRGKALKRAEEMREQAAAASSPLGAAGDAAALLEEGGEAAAADSPPAEAAEREEEEQPQSSAWALLPRALDYAALSARLRRLGSSSGASAGAAATNEAEAEDVEAAASPAPQQRRGWFGWR